MRIVRISPFLLIACLLASSVWAQSPVALVEEVTGNPDGVSFMDYLRTGQVIRLGSQDSLSLSYFSSCLREVIHGGSVKIGVDQSEVASGQVERTKVNCEASKMLNSVGQASDTASLVIRGHRRTTIAPAPPAEFTLYGLSPFIELRGSGTLVIARLDQTGEYISLPIEPSKLLRGAFLDLSAEGRLLSAGGVYGARWQKHLTVFKIDPNAKAGSTPIVGRLLRLESAS